MHAKWTQVPSGSQECLLDVVVDPSRRIWVGGRDGSLLRSDDGGRTFPCVATCTHNVQGVWSDGKGRVVACSGGEIIASDDDGKRWTPTSCRGRYNSNLCWSGGRLWATNIRGKVLSSADGVKWKSVPSTSRKFLYSIGANSSGTVCAGSEGSLALSRDGGATFRVTRLGHREYLRAVHVWESGEAVLVGDDGKVHLVDGAGRVGDGWAPESVSLFCICEVGGELVALGHESYEAAAVRSSNRGHTWEEMPLPDGGQLHAVAAFADGSAVAVGERGAILVLR